MHCRFSLTLAQWHYNIYDYDYMTLKPCHTMYIIRPIVFMFYQNGTQNPRQKNGHIEQ